MTLEQLKSLNDDELAMLWYAVNKTTPPILANIEVEPEIFCSIRPHAIFHRIDQIEPAIKEEHKSIYLSLRAKLNMPDIVEAKPKQSKIDPKPKEEPPKNTPE